jgi:hypothetical protein
MRDYYHTAEEARATCMHDHVLQADVAGFISHHRSVKKTEKCLEVHITLDADIGSVDAGSVHATVNIGSPVVVLPFNI